MPAGEESIERPAQDQLETAAGAARAVGQQASDQEPGEAASVSAPPTADGSGNDVLEVPWRCSDDSIQNSGVWEAGVRLPGFVLDPALLQLLMHQRQQQQQLQQKQQEQKQQKEQQQQQQQQQQPSEQQLLGALGPPVDALSQQPV